MQPDFPAAHSMDTDWFAVDRNGHVAICSSGEPGPVPVGIELQQDIWEALDGLLLGSAAAFFGRHYTGEDWPYSLAMLLPEEFDLNRLADLKSLKRGAVIHVRNERLVPVVINALDDPGIKELHESSVCRGCTAPIDEHFSAGLLNLYRYDAGDRYRNGPYERAVVPSAPVRFAQLPSAIQQLMHPIVFPHVSFADAAVFQPIEHMPCQTWGDAATGRHRGGRPPVPVHELPGRLRRQSAVLLDRMGPHRRVVLVHHNSPQAPRAELPRPVRSPRWAWPTVLRRHRCRLIFRPLTAWTQIGLPSMPTGTLPSAHRVIRGQFRRKRSCSWPLTRLWRRCS